ncbi:MAG: hypothetical protein IPF54_02530 [Draconibacterium sp.]|nr:hypothetical protein [Draconibacterium sp.]
MEFNITHDSRFLATGNQFLYNSLLSRWFYVPVVSQNLPVKPKLFSFPGGFKLNGKLIYTILSTRDEYEMLTTDAEAILAHFYIIPGKEKLKRILSISGKPTIVTVDFAFKSIRNIEPCKKYSNHLVLPDFM